MKPSSKVVHVLFGLRIGGMQRQLARLLPRLKAVGMETEVVCFSEGGPLVSDLNGKGIKCYYIELDKKGWSPRAFLKLLTFSAKMRELKPQALHLHGYPGNVKAALSALVLNVPYILHYRNEHERGGFLDQITEKFVVSKASAVVGVSYSSLVSVEGRTGILGRDSRVILNGIEVGNGPRIGRRRERKTVGLVSRMAAQKRIEDFVQAASISSKMRRDLDFVHVGGGRAKKVRKLRRLVKERKVIHYNLVGELMNPKEIMKDFDVGVLTSEKEGLPNVLLEYLSLGIPTVTTDIAPIKEVVIHGKTGLLVPPRSPKPLSRAFHLLLDAPLLRKRLAVFSKRRATFFSMEKTVKKTLGLYRSLPSFPQEMDSP